jgi:hypothetical protein
VYVNRLELSVVINLLASADGTSDLSNDCCLQFKRSSLASAPEENDYRWWRRGKQELTRVVPGLERTEPMRPAVRPKSRPRRPSPTLQSRLPIGRSN